MTLPSLTYSLSLPWLRGCQWFQKLWVWVVGSHAPYIEFQPRDSHLPSTGNDMESSAALGAQHADKHANKQVYVTLKTFFDT